MENTKAAAAPTGCFKCGRPGHWSRDCPASSSSGPSNLSSNKSGGVNISKSVVGVKEKPKKLPSSRPKLTADLLLSDDGLGFVLRHFPRAFKYRGRGHEVSDLGHLIGLYSEWHAHSLPYYSFDQFIHKVEQVSATRRVKTCIRDLRERVASGGDPTKLHDAPVDQDGLTDEQALLKAMSSERQLHQDLSGNDHSVDDIHEDLFNEKYKKATEEQSLNDMDVGNVLSIGSSNSKKGSPDQLPKIGGISSASNEVNITEEQRSRMEFNRLKALERAASRTRSPLQPS